MQSISRIATIVICICSLFAVIAILTWAQPCAMSIETATGNMVPMRCHYTAHIGVLLGLVLAMVSAAIAISGRPLDGPLFVTCFLLALSLLLVSFDTPLSIGVCKTEGMACANTAFCLRVCGALSMLASLGGVIANPERKRV